MLSHSIRKLLNAPLKGAALASWYPPELRHNVHGYVVRLAVPPLSFHMYSCCKNLVLECSRAVRPKAT